MALGAQQGNVLRLVIGGGARLAAIGIAVGLTAALTLTQLMKVLLFGVRPTDPFTFTAVIALLAVTSILACYIPARRAMRVDPIEALRCE